MFKSKKTTKIEKKNSTSVNKDTHVITEEVEMAKNVESIETVVNNSFFYSNTKMFEQSDNVEILSYIIKRYPNFSTENTDSVIKKTLLEMMSNESFVRKLLRRYDITIYDLFKIFYKNYSSLFKGQFLKKLKNELEAKAYAKIKSWK